MTYLFNFDESENSQFCLFFAGKKVPKRCNDTLSDSVLPKWSNQYLSTNSSFFLPVGNISSFCRKNGRCIFVNISHNISAKLTREAQSRRSLQVPTALLVSASSFSFSIFSCPIKISPLGADYPPKPTSSLFRANYPLVKHFQRKSYSSTCSRWKLDFDHFPRQKLYLLLFFKVLKLALHFKPRTSLSSNGVFWRVFDTLINFVWRLLDQPKSFIIRAKGLLGILYGWSSNFSKILNFLGRN